MDTRKISVAEATAHHFDAIAEIERASAELTPVVLTNGASLQQALDRGHWLAVALDGQDTLGWIWFSIELGRTGEYVGRIFRVAVAEAARRSGTGTALLSHANRVFAERDVAAVRITIADEAEGARQFFEAAGFSTESLTMERRL